ncbi:hypothetical protein MKW92_033138 [Papaver armeniacum]|nr:hypothetical protein MKW92_033138 [Papaver armeniacum]
MVQKSKGGGRPEKYYQIAREQGYRSKASLKLLQLESKFNFLKSAHAVLDLCAAPGGWMQVAVKKIPVGGFVLGVDLYPIKPIRGAISVEEDITTDKCRATIKDLMRDNGVRRFDVVLHDGSPNIGGAWAQEATTQNSLVMDAVRLATEFLSPNGTFVTKIFRSQDYNKVSYCLKQLFDKVEVTKPIASRSTSAETYIVSKNYKAPAKIDPRLLNLKYLIDIEQENAKVNVLGEPIENHPTIWYNDMSPTRVVALASDFVWSETPLEVLGTAASISFKDPACLFLKDHSLTTEEVKMICENLLVMGKQEFKHLMKWRIDVRKAMSPTQKTTPPKISDAEDENKSDEDDDKILNEMKELTYTMASKKRRAKELIAKRQAKIDASEDGYVDDELFSQKRKPSKKAFDEKELYKGDDAVELDHDSDRETVANEANPLMISLQEEEAQTQEQVTQQWFSQDIFAEAAKYENIWGEMESESEMKVDTKQNMSVAQAKARKKRVALRQRENVKRKANAISDQTDKSKSKRAR